MQVQDLNATLFCILAIRKRRMDSQGCLGLYVTVTHAKSPAGQDVKNVVYGKVLSSIIKDALA